VPSAVALLNYISSGLLWQIFSQTGTFRGVFSPYISFITLEGSAQLRLGGAGDIMYFLRGFFFILFAERIREAAMGGTGVWGHNKINMTI
jgi:hypothetical protein